MVGGEATIVRERQAEKTIVPCSFSLMEVSFESSDKHVLFRIPREVGKLVRSHQEEEVLSREGR